MRRQNRYFDLRLALRAERGELVGLLRSNGVECAVGPSEPGGWVVVALDLGTDPDPLAEQLSRSVSPLVLTTAVDVSGASLRLRIWQRGAVTTQFGWRRGGRRPQGLDEIAIALDVSPVDLPEQPGDLTAGELMRRIVDRLPLPPTLVDHRPTSELVLHRGRPADLHTVAAIAGPAWLLTTGSGWHVLVPAAEPGGPGHPPSSAAGLAAGLSSLSGRLGTVQLWLDDQHGCGYSLWQKSRCIDVHSWNSPWEKLPDTAPDDQRGDAALLAQACGQPDQTVLLRALLRRDAEPAELLAELTSLARFPAESAELLLGTTTPDRLTGAQLVERTSTARAIMTHARSPLLADSPKLSRALTWTMLVVSIAVALVGVLLTVVGVAVVATDGAIVDEQGVAADDWWGIAIGAALTAVATWSAFARRRTLRRTRRHAPESDNAEPTDRP